MKLLIKYQIHWSALKLFESRTARRTLRIWETVAEAPCFETSRNQIFHGRRGCSLYLFTTSTANVITASENWTKYPILQFLELIQNNYCRTFVTKIELQVHWMTKHTEHWKPWCWSLGWGIGCCHPQLINNKTRPLGVIALQHSKNQNISWANLIQRYPPYQHNQVGLSFRVCGTSVRVFTSQCMLSSLYPNTWNWLSHSQVFLVSSVAPSLKIKSKANPASSKTGSSDVTCYLAWSANHGFWVALWYQALLLRRFLIKSHKLMRPTMSSWQTSMTNSDPCLWNRS